MFDTLHFFIVYEKECLVNNCRLPLFLLDSHIKHKPDVRKEKS